jgi:hypothetical protein
MVRVELQADFAADHLRVLVQPIEQRRTQRLCHLIAVLEIARVADIANEWIAPA